MCSTLRWTSSEEAEADAVCSSLRWTSCEEAEADAVCSSLRWTTSKETPDGVQTVIVGGVVTVSDGALVRDAQGGRPIRRGVQ